MKILERYILKCLIGPYILSLVTSLFLLTLGRMVQIAKYLFRTSVTLQDIVELIFLATPRLSGFALPLATILTVTITLNRLASSGELIAIEGSGIPIQKLYRPFLIFTAANTILAMIITLTILHHANTLFREKIYHIGKSSVTAIFQEGTFIDVIPGFVFYFQKVSSKDLTINGIYVEDFREKKVSFTVIASRGKIEYNLEEGSIIFILEDGTITQISKDESVRILNFERYELTLPGDELFSELSKASSNKWEMNMAELWRASHQALSTRERNRYGLEFHHRIAMPFLSVIMGMLMLPLTMMKPLRKFTLKGSGVSVALISFLLFYMATALGKGLSENNLISPALAVYVPTGMFLLILLYCWHKMVHIPRTDGKR